MDSKVERFGARGQISVMFLLAILLAPRCAAFAFASRANGDGRVATLTTIAQVHALSKQEALRFLPVRLRPVVTYFDPVAHNLFLNDATGGIWMGWRPELPKLKVGDLLDFKAETDFTFAPDLKNASWAVIGRAPMPAPRRVSYEEMISTSEDSQWVEVEGTVRQTEYLHRRPTERILWMDLAMSGNDIDVEIPWDGSPVPPGLIDARGICGAEFNPKNQTVGVKSKPARQRAEFTERGSITLAIECTAKEDAWTELQLKAASGWRASWARAAGFHFTARFATGSSLAGEIAAEAIAEI